MLFYKIAFMFLFIKYSVNCEIKVYTINCCKNESEDKDSYLDRTLWVFIFFIYFDSKWFQISFISYSNSIY